MKRLVLASLLFFAWDVSMAGRPPILTPTPGPKKAVSKKKRTAKPSPTATATSTVLPQQVAPPPGQESQALYAFDKAWGSPGSTLSQLQFPEGIDVTDDGEIYIADTGNNRVLVWNEEGTPLRTFGTFGPTAAWRNPPQFNHPTGLLVLPEKKTLVADTLNHRIVVVDPQGLVVGSWGSRGQGDGEFERPRNIAMDHFGNIWVLDSGNSRVQIFGGLGGYKNQWGSFGSEQGQLKYPLGFALNIIDQACVADTENYRVQVFNDQGTPVTMFGWYGDGPAQFKEPGGVAITPNGIIAMVDGVNSRVVFLNSRFEPIGDLKATERDPKTKAAPHFRGIASDRQGRFYVTDIQNHRIVRLSPLKKNVVVEHEPTPTPSESDLYGGPGYPVR